MVGRDRNTQQRLDMKASTEQDASGFLVAPEGLKGIIPFSPASRILTKATSALILTLNQFDK
jgi:hypothetical protein